MQIRLIPLADVTEAEAAAWQDLAEHALAPNMCLDPRFLRPARHLGPEADEVRLLVAQDGDRWQAVLGVTTRRLVPRIPVRVFTTDGSFMNRECDRHHPLVRADGAAEALDALLRGARPAGLPGIAQLRRFPAVGPLADLLVEVAGRRGMRVVDRGRDVGVWAPREAFEVLDVPAPVDGVLVDPPLSTGHLRTDEARNVRRTVRGLVREAGPLALHDESGDPAAVDRFVTLQAAGWKGDAARGGAALGLDPAADRWFRDLVSGFRRDGDLRVLRLTAGEETVWTGFQVRSGGGWFGALDAYDERFRRFSPGSIGRIATMTYLLGTTDAPFVDPGFGSSYAVGARIWPASRAQVDLLIATRGPTAHAVLRAAPLARRFGLVA